MEFHRDNGYLHCEGVRLVDLADRHGTPTYVYSEGALRARFQALDRAFAAIPHLICFATKANGNIGVTRVLASMGAGADVVSGGELFRALRAGVPANRIVFAGVGKTATEIGEALDAGILMFNVESEAELDQIAAVAAGRGKRAPIALRVNPDVDPQTHHYIATGLKKYKFGVPADQVVRLYQKALASPHLDPIGIQMHIGSQLVHVQPIADAVAKVAGLVKELQSIGVLIRYFDVGGGLGITYSDESPDTPADLAERIVELIGGVGATLVSEPGRFIVGNSGVLLTRVLYVKDNGAKTFLIVDAGMNDLIRPSLYDAYHGIEPAGPAGAPQVVDVVGPVCESGDFFAHDRQIPAVKAGDVLAIMSAGAYGFTMASNYNARPRAAEILVSGDRDRVVRRRETYQDLIRGEEEA